MDFLKGKENLSNLFLRLGLAATLLWSVRTKFSTPEVVAGLFNKFGLTFFGNVAAVQVVATVLLISGILLVIGAFTRINGIFLSIYFLVTVILGIGTGFAIGPAVWKDFALLGGALALTFGGPGAYSIDEKMGK